MKFSIIIPTLNEEKLLPVLLDQIDNRELKEKYDYEIIISDGGSKDSTESIALERADKLTVHRKKQKQNISQGRNDGAHYAEGEWLIFLNADVVISDPNKFFDILSGNIDSGKYTGITFSVNVNKEESIISDRIFLGFYNFFFHFLNIVGLGMGRGECLVVPHALFNELGGFNSKLAAGEDFDLFKRVRRHGKIYFSHKVSIYESPRRYRKYGHLNVMFTWLLNSVFVLFQKRSMSKEWEEVR